jgi:hypothetical protein
VAKRNQQNQAAVKRPRTILAVALVLLGGSAARTFPGVLLAGETRQELPPLPQFHLTARPWKALNISREAGLDALEGLCRFSVKHLDTNGAIIDPFLKREQQYATPYFAAAIGALMRTGRAREIWPAGVRAMDHATACFARGDNGIPDRHGEFFDASLAEALGWYRGHVPESKLRLWRERLKIPRDRIIQGPVNNWRTYAMRGEWLRSQLDLADHTATVDFISNCWWHDTQRDRFTQDQWNLYHDRETDPESFAVEAVGRGNLLGLIASGYDGAARGEMWRCVERGTRATLLLQDPSGQCPPNGRADDHVWNDVLYQLAFDTMAQRLEKAGDHRLASQYRRAAMLSFKSAGRWRRSDGEWAGSYYVTKNRFNPAQRVGYQAASNYGNYNGTLMLLLAEDGLAQASEIPEAPAPVEIGGYAFPVGGTFSAVSADAGGMQLFAALRADTNLVYGHYWTALGVERMGRVNWDTRLGPSDGVRDAHTGLGVTFAPTWVENGRWVKMADVPERYCGHFTAEFAHPLLVRCAIDYRPLPGKSGPEFRHEFIITPDGILAVLRARGAKEFGVTWPLLENDGTPLDLKVSDRMATTSLGSGGDQQCFLSFGETGSVPVAQEALLSSYGWIRPVRVAAEEGVSRCFVFPRSEGDPRAEVVRESFHVTKTGFRSVLGAVAGHLYVGRYSAGGEGTSVDCDGDGRPDAVFDHPCRFILQLSDGRITAAEADREITVHIYGKSYRLHPYAPVRMDERPATPQG